MLEYLHLFFQALLFSCVVESIAAALLAHYLKKEKWIALIAVAGTCLTLPYVWFVFPTLFWLHTSLGVLLAEIFAFSLETLLYRYWAKLSWRMAILFSFTANSLSYFLYLLIRLY